MATIAQIRNGLARYIETEIIARMTGWQKWVFGAGASLALANLATTINELKEHELVKMLGVIDKDGNVNVARIYQEVKKQSGKGPITFNVPGMGDLTLNDSDVDKIHNMIMGG